jgi:hypothetical protein
VGVLEFIEIFDTQGKGGAVFDFSGCLGILIEKTKAPQLSLRRFD